MKTTNRLKSLCLASIFTLAVVFSVASLTLPAPANAQSEGLSERIKQYQREFNIELSRSKAERFKLRCGVAQTVTRNLRTRIAAIQEKRGQVYSSIITRLTELEPKISQKGIDTSKLKSQTETLEQKINEFNSNLTTYKQAVEDMADMDCAADPSGFNAALLTARKAHGKLVLAVGDIRTYINNAIKPTLLQIKEQLKDKNMENDDHASH